MSRQVFEYQPPPTPWLEIVHRDDDILLLKKPTGLLSVPGRPAAHRDSLFVRAQRVFPTARVVHRLDMDTSGLVLLALSEEAQRNLSRQFAVRAVEKTYVAIVDGILCEDEGLVDLPLICDWPNRPLQKVDHAVGKPSQTRWRVLARENGRTRIKLMPLTGRSHQLRVHMAALGHPIVGDRFYAFGPARDAASRLMLHAERLAFQHPASGAFVSFQSSPPF